MKEEKMWDEKVVIRLYFFLLSLVSCYFFVNLHHKKQGTGFCSTLKQEFDSLSKDEKNNILLNLKPNIIKNNVLISEGHRQVST